MCPLLIFDSKFTCCEFPRSANPENIMSVWKCSALIICDILNHWGNLPWTWKCFLFFAFWLTASWYYEWWGNSSIIMTCNYPLQESNNSITLWMKINQLKFTNPKNQVSCLISTGEKILLLKTCVPS